MRCELRQFALHKAANHEKNFFTSRSRTAKLTRMNLAAAFVKSAKTNSAKPALFSGETEFSHADALGRSAVVGVHLRGQLAVKPGDRVGIWLKNCPEFIFSLFGIWLADGVVVPINN